MKKILIVEDEKDLVEVLSFRLEKLGFKVFSAFNGKSGLATAKQELPDLIILDVMLPVMDGYRVCKELKGDSSTSAIPIIMLTARALDTDAKIGKDVGADDYMIKPFDDKDLIKRIQQLL